MFKEEFANEIVGGFRFIGDIFEGFVGGKLVDSVIIGIICYVGCIILKLDYPLLISVIVGVTNLAPTFGPILGAVIAMLIPIIPLHFASTFEIMLDVICAIVGLCASLAINHVSQKYLKKTAEPQQ